MSWREPCPGAMDGSILPAVMHGPCQQGCALQAYDAYAELLGLKGIVVRDPEQLGAAWDEAFNADRPVIMNVYADPTVPPLLPSRMRGTSSTMMLSEPELGSGYATGRLFPLSEV